MKKLFTLFAFLAMFLGANAETFVDAEVDFSTMADGSEIKFYGWGASESARARLSIKNGCLHFESTEATDPNWDCQFHPIGFSGEAEIDVVYTLHFKVKGSVAQNISALGFGQTPYGQFPITTEWVEGTFDYTAKVDGNGNAPSGAILFQCGDYVGEFDIAYLKITHEAKAEKPVQWSNLLTNGDAEGQYGAVACAYAKEYVAGADEQPEPYAAKIETLDGNKVFAVHAKAVNPPIVWDEDGEQWGVTHKAGDPKPDNAWQNQFWINLPEGIAEGTQLKVSFKVKASKGGLKADLQTHRKPSDYLGGFNPGTIEIGTDWTPYEQTFSAPAKHNETGELFQSIAFNLGVGEQYKEDIDFYFDDLELSEMVLDHGFFVAGSNTTTGLEYDYDNAIQFTQHPTEADLVVATVGTKGKKDTWVSEVMISTVRGNDKAFKAATIKPDASVTDDPEIWPNYTTSSSAKIKLPAAGVWTISIAPEDKQMNFVKVEGEEAKEPVDIVTNASEIVVNALERDWKPAKDDGTPQDGEDGVGEGQPWDNQFWIVANRELEAGEVTVVSFKYKATKAAGVSTQSHNMPGQYIHWAALNPNPSFTTEWQDYEAEFTVPAQCDGSQNNNGGYVNNLRSIAFNLSEIKAANDYSFKDFKWYLKSDVEGKTLENLIDETGQSNFYWKVKGGEITQGIINVVDNRKASAVIYNLAGQRVSKDYKGIVVSNGRKVVNK